MLLVINQLILLQGFSRIEIRGSKCKRWLERKKFVFINKKGKPVNTGYGILNDE